MPNHDNDLRSDGELLGAFLERRDQAAFETVVRRHERLVLNVCARVLGNRQEAHDAAQAAFLALALKAGDLDRNRPLGPWLHRVSHGAAVNARKSREARRVREREAAAMAERNGARDEAWESIRADLDRELDALPDRYRRPLVLFHLEGRSIEETAAALDSAPGTVGSWLSRGRELLRGRLVRNGTTALPVALLAALLSGEASAQSPPAGFAAWTARGAISGEGVSAHVLALAKGTVPMSMHGMGWVAVAAAALLGVGVLTRAPETPGAAIGERVYATASLPATEEVETLADVPQAEPATGASRVSDLAGWWTLDETADDASGANRHGKIVGAVARGEGKSKGCFVFDGKGGHIEAPNTPELDKVEQGSYTLAAWFKPAILPPGSNDDANDGAYGIVVKTGWHVGLTYTREGTFLMTHWLAGKDEPEWKGAGSWGQSCDPGKWHHVAGVVNRAAGTIQIFVNGEGLHTEEFEKDRAARTSDGTSWKIGIASPGAEKWSWPANGAIDDVRIYGRALSPMEVKGLADLK